MERLWLDWYPGMTEASVAAIAQAAQARFAVTALTIHHRAGVMTAGGIRDQIWSRLKEVSENTLTQRKRSCPPGHCSAGRDEGRFIQHERP